LGLPAFNPCLEAPPEVPDYTPGVQRDLLACHLAALLGDIHPLPLLALVGQKGGGKTTLAKALLRMLLGPAASVTSLPSDVKDYWTQVTTAPVVAFDNVDDEVPHWLLDELAGTVTGKRVEMRELYTNNTKLSRPATAALVITTRTASFCRADIAERSLPLLTDEFGEGGRIADSDLLAEVDAHRDGLLSWCAVAGAKLQTERDHAPDGLDLRFVDYARLVWAYMQKTGRAESVPQMLRALRRAQALTVGEADPLVEAIAMHLDQLCGDSDWRGSASDLIRALGAAGADLPFFGGGKRITRQLRESRATLAIMGVTLREERDAHRHVTFTLFRAQSAQNEQSGKSSGTTGAYVEHAEQRLSRRCSDCADCATPRGQDGDLQLWEQDYLAMAEKIGSTAGRS
jgi:hypothetical protein